MQKKWVRDLTNWSIAAAVFLCAFLFYDFTGPSDIAWMDGAEYQRRVAMTDVGDGPWDSSLFVVLSQPFLLLPWGKLTSRANWASAAFAAGACLFVYLLMRHFLTMAPRFIARWVGVLTATSLALTHTFWMRAVTPAPEPLDAFLIAGLLYFLVKYSDEGRSYNLYLGMGLLGLSLSNNLLFLCLVPIIFVYVRIVEPPLIRNLGVVRLRGLVCFAATAMLALGVAGLGWYRAGGIPEAHWQWIQFWDHHLLLSWEPPLQQSLIRLGTLLALNFPVWTLLIGLVGAYELYRRQKSTFWLLMSLFFVYATFAVILDHPDPVSTYLPLWVLLAVCVGFGWWKILSNGNWTAFALAMVLSLAPILIYRYTPRAIRTLGWDLRVQALLNHPWELPVDGLSFRINPDRRNLSDTRSFAEHAMDELPPSAEVLLLSASSELMTAPLRYLAEVERRHGVAFVTATEAEDLPGRFVMGLHPANPLVTSALDRYRFQPVGDWLRLETVSTRSAVNFSSSEASGARIAESVSVGDDDALRGTWRGFVSPQGYPIELSVQGAAGALTGTATLRASQSREWSGQFTRLSSTVGAVLGTVVFGEGDELHLHIDATQQDGQMHGTWKIYELESLSGRFRVWKQRPTTPFPESD